MRLVLALLLAVPWMTAWGQTLDQKAFEAYVTRSLATFEVPGAAVAIVKGGEVVLAEQEVLFIPG